MAAVLLSFSVFDLTKLHRRFSLGGFAGEVLRSVFLRPRSPRNHFDALPIAYHKFWVSRKNKTCVKKNSNSYEGERKKRGRRKKQSLLVTKGRGGVGFLSERKKLLCTFVT